MNKAIPFLILTMIVLLSNSKHQIPASRFGNVSREDIDNGFVLPINLRQ